jgi:hypothetical protein
MSLASSGKDIRGKREDVLVTLVSTIAHEYHESKDAELVARLGTASAAFNACASFGNITGLLAQHETLARNKRQVQDEFLVQMAEWTCSLEGRRYLRHVLTFLPTRTVPNWVLRISAAADAPAVGTVVKAMSKDEHEEAHSLWATLVEDVTAGSPLAHWMMTLKQQGRGGGEVLSRAATLSLITDDQGFKVAHAWFLLDFFLDFLPSLHQNVSERKFEEVQEQDFFPTTEKGALELPALLATGNTFVHQVARLVIAATPALKRLALPKDIAEPGEAALEPETPEFLEGSLRARRIAPRLADYAKALEQVLQYENPRNVSLPEPFHIGTQTLGVSIPEGDREPRLLLQVASALPRILVFQIVASLLYQLFALAKGQSYTIFGDLVKNPQRNPVMLILPAVVRGTYQPKTREDYAKRPHLAEHEDLADLIAALVQATR